MRAALTELAEIIADIDSNHTVEGTMTTPVLFMDSDRGTHARQASAAMSHLSRALADKILEDCQVKESRLVSLSSRHTDGPHGPSVVTRARACVINPEKLRQIERLVLDLLRYDDFRVQAAKLEASISE